MLITCFWVQASGFNHVSVERDYSALRRPFYSFVKGEIGQDRYVENLGGSSVMEAALEMIGHLMSPMRKSSIPTDGNGKRRIA